MGVYIRIIRFAATRTRLVGELVLEEVDLLLPPRFLPVEIMLRVVQFPVQPTFLSGVQSLLMLWLRMTIR